MKQESPASLEAAAATTTTPKSVIKLQNSLTPSRLRLPSNYKEPPKTPPEVVNGVVSTPSRRAKSVTPELKHNSRVKRGLVMNKAKPNEEVVGNQRGREVEEAKVVARFVSRHVVEQFSRPRSGDFGFKRDKEDPDGKNKKELMEKLVVSESLIKNLQSEVLALKAELEKVKGLNVELESNNRKLTRDLAAAEAKVVSLGSNEKEPNGEHQNPKFKHIQKLIADKLERSIVKKEASTDGCFVKAPIPAPTAIPSVPDKITTSIGRKPVPNSCLPPPPPPIPPSIPSRPIAKANNSQRAPAFVKLFHSLKNQEGMKSTTGSIRQQKPVAVNVHSSIVGEIQNRSAHLLAIRADIETKGEFINSLIKKVVEAAYTNIEDVLNFVNWLDGELSSLADERAVLKHFNWPERKADAMREAAVEYREIKLLEQEISSFKDDPEIPCGVSLRKMANLLDKSECSIQRLIKLRNSAMRSYQEYKIPTSWMLDSGIMTKIKQASMLLVKMYMKRLRMELGSARNSDRQSSQESLLLQGMHFAYRAHQIAGGLDAETLCAFEEIRQHVPAGHLAGSPELLAGIASS
ncbi:protein CHUP1, chloroplastic [Cajanus cajan]|uniref:protein CHUP1, chloroplastic n=1 Tax=Cajanus cajan TaxID=3821 RepID=UPI00098D7579|nr:protein CHUP1, chloroplastic [Cajanus cajan]XP_020220839.1 protein CHUP1, chloroplastic [Cajanus cajan]XP_020220841.1 protein CHUP1, chloroplastic [Cajanus cajan]